MMRIRTIKPDFYRHERLYQLNKETGLPVRIGFAGLFGVADREGRFRWRPAQLKLDIVPYDDVDFAAVLEALANAGFIIKYRANGQDYGCIPSWSKHQCINKREAASELPPVPEITYPQENKWILPQGETKAAVVVKLQTIAFKGNIMSTTAHQKESPNVYSSFESTPNASSNAPEFKAIKSAGQVLKNAESKIKTTSELKSVSLVSLEKEQTLSDCQTSTSPKISSDTAQS